MNEQLQQALANILGKTLDGIDTATAFVQSELPDVIQQLLTWYAVKGFLFFVIGMIALASPYFIIKLLIKYTDDIDLGSALGSAISIVPVIIGLLMINLDWLQIWIAPKIWLIEYAADLAK